MDPENKTTPDDPTSGTAEPKPADPSSTADNKSADYPAATKPADMSPEQQTAYFRDLARKHEDRNKDLLKITGGKYGDALRADIEELNSLRSQSLTDQDRAVEAARTDARAEVTREFGNRLAAAEFRAALSHIETERRDQIIEGLNLAHYLSDDGEVDTDKVHAYAATIAPAVKEEAPVRPDFGAGRRSSKPASGLGAGADLFAASRSRTTAS